MPESDTVAEEVRAATAPAFLAGGGEMGALMRTHDWSTSALGPPETWPQSLRTAVSILLTSKYPMFIAWGPELAFLYNDGYRPILGAKHPAALGRPFARVWEEIWSDIAPLVDRALASEATWSDDLRLFMERSGYPEEVYFTFSYSPIRDETGGVGGMFCACTETTGKVLGERRLRCLRDLAATVAQAKTVEQSYALCMDVLGEHQEDLPFALLYRLDEPRAELVGVTPTAAGSSLAPETMSIATGLWPLARVAVGESETLCDLQARIADAPVSAWGDPVRSALILPISDRGRGEASAALVLGVSPRRALDADYRIFFNLVASSIATAIANARAYEAERRRAEALAELDRAKTAFFSNISHEFRTPLTLMLGTLEEALSAADVSAARRAELMIAHRNGLRLLRLVNTLLDFSRVEAGRIEASYEPVDLAALTAELASNFRSACERAGLRLDVECEALPQPIYVDREMWEKIVLNLLSNAFKYTLHGGIAVRLAARDGKAVLAVTDTGTGIPKEEQPRVFQRFHRVAGARGRTHEGTGIGLALVKELVELHGGTVAVQSEPGAGSTFSVSIPFGSAHLPAARIGVPRRLVSTSLRAEAFVEEALRWLPDGQGADDHQLLGSEFRQAPRTGEPLRRRRVLIVDDNADMRDYVVRLLRPHHDVDTAHDGLQALAAIRARRPDLVISDVMMPGLDGFGLLRAVRSDPALAGIPVILLSARAGEEAQVEGLEAGADDYLVKPFSARELLARVNTNLQMAEIRRRSIEEVLARERELQSRAALLDAIMQTVPAAIWVAHDREASRMTGSRYAAEMLRLPPGANHSQTARPEERPSTFRIMKDGREVPPERLPVQRACRGEVVRLEELDLVFSDGSVVHELVNAAPVRDEAGRITGAVGAAIDITARKHAEAQRELLINELNHRVKNTLASVQSIAMQTMRSARSPEEFRDAFVSRLIALSRAHDLLTRGKWQAATLEEIVRETLEPYGPAAGRIGFGGPAVRLNPSTAVTLSMALHELATNAAKYGALSGAQGTVAIRWNAEAVDTRPQLAIEWTERGGPEVSPPCRRGFGSRLLERGIAQELDGEVSLEFDPAGVRCRIRLPLTEKVSVP